LDTNDVACGIFSEGIHAWDNTDNKNRFWSFDAYGSITEGLVQTKNKEIRYVHEHAMPDGTKKR
jgi:hypothetical protein